MTAHTDDRPFSPDYAVPPGATLSELLERRDMTQSELAKRLGVSAKHVNQVVKGVAPLSTEMALGLEKVLGTPVAFWIKREAVYQARRAETNELESLAEHVSWAKRFPVKELKRIDLIPPTASGSDLVWHLLRFLGIAHPKQWTDPSVDYRKSQRFESDPYALSAWLRVAELRAAEIECAPYDSERFADTLHDIRGLTCLEPEEWHPLLVKKCAEAGVAVVIVDTFKGARANGATRWLSPTKALIQLSLRYTWEDIFWFTFFHEAGHVLLHRKKERFVEVPPSKRDDSIAELEQEADRFAGRTLIPQHFERRLPRLTLNDVPGFARELGIAPAIVVGRLQHDRLLPHSRGNDLRRQFEFVD
ncbi:HigA family addiction module antitoxin [Svornostia abyssi]|uniref:HigA family addiction module antitoxin n=1 Tax=Svornostia abyssi TaxID=2898438 RepID=A0ABY5PM07_9ACTN|nr:HigA family addiction module antitoxin [Parviterribacteraceae bacterium J379]